MSDSFAQSAALPFLGKRVAVLLYSSYPSDPRPRRAAESMAELGASVEVICLRQRDDEPAVETIGRVHVRRLAQKHKRGGKLTYFWQYFAFICATFFILGARTLRRRYDLVHVHNMPDVLVFSALVPKLRGARVLLDLHDPMPELMMTIFGERRQKLIRLLKHLEKWSMARSHAVLTVNETCKKIFSGRSCRADKITVIMNSPDEKIFAFRPVAELAFPSRRERFAIMYHGSIVERHGLDLAVAALEQILPTCPTATLEIYGQKTPFLDQVLAAAKDSPVSQAVRYHGPKNLEQIVAAIRTSDVGVIPNRRSIFTELNTPTRIFEYLSQGLPVVAPRAPGICDYFGDNDLAYFELGDATDLGRQLRRIHDESSSVPSLVGRGQQVYLQHRWANEKQALVDRTATLLGVPSSHASSPPVAATVGI
ncbi:MAG TPA: glycosyltransferase family 4 protein [Candidatus Didemnitutus sp.]|nr:glycosyltransferase family 4 protein [Candidatus Didemnitutus sp.]